MTIKKAYVEIHSLLVKNKDKKVSEILDLITEMCERQTDDKYVKDSEGNVVAIFDYYFKKWLPTSTVEFGSKASNKATGLNTMCVLGNKLWTQQQTEFKKSKDEILEKIMKGDLTVEAAEVELQKIESHRQRIQMNLCPEDNFDTVEEVLEFINN